MPLPPTDGNSWINIQRLAQSLLNNDDRLKSIRWDGKELTFCRLDIGETEDKIYGDIAYACSCEATANCDPLSKWTSSLYTTDNLRWYLKFSPETRPTYIFTRDDVEEPFEMNKELLVKIQNGDHISDQELVVSIEFYSDLETKLALLGAHFHLAWKEVFFVLNQLKQYKFHREFGGFNHV